MFSFQRTELQTRHHKRLFARPEERFWKNFEPVLETQASPHCSDLVFNEKKNFLAFSTLKEIKIFDLASHQQAVLAKKEKLLIRSLAVRADGELLAWGNEAGITKILACKQKVVLKEFGEANSDGAVLSLDWAVRAKSWVANGYSNGKFSVVDFVNKKSIFENLEFHSDVVRGLAFIDQSDQLLATAGLDRKIGIFDIRTGGDAVKEIDFGFGVETLKVFRSGEALYARNLSIWEQMSNDNQSGLGLLFAAGGRKVACYDPRKTETPVFQFTNNIKTVGSLALSENRLVSAAQDGIVKVYSPQAFDQGVSGISATGVDISNKGENVKAELGELSTKSISLSYQQKHAEGLMSISTDSAALNYATLTLEGRLTVHQKPYFNSQRSNKQSKGNDLQSNLTGNQIDTDNQPILTSNGIKYSQKALIARLARGFRIADRGSYKFYNRGAFQKFSKESQATRIIKKKSGKLAKHDVFLKR